MAVWFSVSCQYFFLWHLCFSGCVFSIIVNDPLWEYTSHFQTYHQFLAIYSPCLKYKDFSSWTSPSDLINRVRLTREERLLLTSHIQIWKMFPDFGQCRWIKTSLLYFTKFLSLKKNQTFLGQYTKISKKTITGI